MSEPRLEKVTTFVTRGSGAATQLLVFYHARSGVQVPAGTVEPGEAPLDAARRELAEETGITSARLVQTLVRQVDELAPDARAALRTEPLRTEPKADAPLAGGVMHRGQTVPCSGEENGYARIGLLEWEDLSQEPRVLLSERWGWVPDGSVCTRRVRDFYHFTPTSPTADAWARHTTDGDNAVFELYWVPLEPRPDLIAEQAEWLDAWYQALLAGARIGA